MHSIRFQQGFMLVEALVAIVIITVALVAIGGLYLQSGRSANISTEYTTAANLAQKQFELLKARQQSPNPLLTSTTTYPYEFDDLLDQSLSDSVSSSLPTFHVKTKAVQCTEETSTNLLEVTVTISWKNKQNVSYNIPFTTFFPKVAPAS